MTDDVFTAPPAWAAAPPYQQQQQPIRPIGGLGRMLAGLLAVGTVVDLAAAAASRPRLDLLQRLRDAPARVTEAEVATSDATYAGIGIAQMAVFAVTAVLFLIWFVRAYRNAEARGGYLRHSPGWAIGAWFVPFLNLVRPKRIADDIWRSSGDPDDDSVPGYVHAWWLTYLGALVCGRISAKMPAETVEQLMTATRFDVATDLFGVVAGVLAILVVWRLTDRQRDWTGEVTPASSGASTPSSPTPASAG